ncbi:MAG TPA: hypothetical protein VMX55_00500 [candidate division Zixibacteria bacterium]|nr:hypothetical protein [candidate division Zixibacteria bacterium]
MIPKFMLKKLYVTGSLTQDNGEVIFKLTNNLYTGTVTSIESIKINEQEYDLETINIDVGNEKVNVSKITSENPFLLEKGGTFTFRVRGNLNPGKHKIDFSLLTKEAGKIAFDIEDEF